MEEDSGAPVLAFGFETRVLLGMEELEGLLEDAVHALGVEAVVVEELSVEVAGFGGFFHDRLHLDIVFTWRAVLAALGVMSFPLLVRSTRVALEQVNPRFEQIARTLGAGDLRVFFSITIPLALRGIIGGVILAFARALGEFGATIMVAGNIPGKTSTLSLSIYQSWFNGEDAAAYRLLGASVALAFAAVWTSEWFMRRSRK